MPELPDLVVYREALERRLLGQRLTKIRIAGPSLLRTVDPPLRDAHGKLLRRISLLGKHLIFGLEDEMVLLVHLMIAGRLHWRPAMARIPARVGLAAFDFPHGTVLLTEAGTKKRAALYVIHGEEPLRRFDAGGLDPMTANRDAYQAALTRETHTVKRALTDPKLFSGIGNAYSDEILHRARLSPVLLTSKVNDEQTTRLYEATQSVLLQWIDRLRLETGEAFPERVTAFRDGMMVHGRYRQPCPICHTPVQRILYAENECNYCPTCQTGGRLLADRALSRLLKSDWPRSLDEMTALRSRQQT